MPALPENPPQPVVVPADTGESLTIVPGTTVVRKLTKDATGGRFSMIEYTVGPKFVAPPVLHWHTKEMWMGYVLSGRIALRFVDRSEEVAAGGTIVVPANCPFAWSNPADEPAKVLFVYAPGGFDQYFSDAYAVTQRHPGVPIKDLTPELLPLWRQYAIEAEG